MGESKRKAQAACRCGSELAANTCCLTDKGWHKKPERVNLRSTGQTGMHRSCYLNSTNACCDKISGEHIVSESVLKVLAETEVELSGAPWLQGKKKILKFGALRANCLCKIHNSSLSPIDSAGAKFFDAIQKCGTTDNGVNFNFLISGHDLERWMFRTLAAFAASKNLSVDGAVLDSNLINRLRVADLLENPFLWIRPMGMYFMQSVNQSFVRKDDFGLAPLLHNETNEISGMLFNIQGLQLALLAANHDVKETALEKVAYRPGALIFKIGRLIHKIQLCWDDKESHPSVQMVWRPN